MSTTFRPIPVVSTVPARSPLPKLVELEDLHTLGWVTIHNVGDENVYMTDGEGVEHYAKP